MKIILLVLLVGLMIIYVYRGPFSARLRNFLAPYLTRKKISEKKIWVAEGFFFLLILLIIIYAWPGGTSTSVSAPDLRSEVLRQEVRDGTHTLKKGEKIWWRRTMTSFIFLKLENTGTCIFTFEREGYPNEYWKWKSTKKKNGEDVGKPVETTNPCKEGWYSITPDRDVTVIVSS